MRKAKQPQLSDKEKSLRRKRYDKRREHQWYKERDAMRAEMKRRREELARLEAAVGQQGLMGIGQALQVLHGADLDTF